MPDIELVYFEGCPYAAEARRRLAQALEALHLRPAWREWDLGGDGVPDRVMGYASPTVLVDGHDVAGDAGLGAGLRCAAGGPPAVEAIIAAVRRAGPTL